MGRFTYSKFKVANQSWFAHFSMRICGGAQLSNCSYLVDHKSIPLISHVTLIGQKSFWEDKNMAFGCASLPSIAII